MQNPSNPTTPTGAASGIRRRAVVTTAAWSVPAIAVAVAAPLASASVPPVGESPAVLSNIGDTSFPLSYEQGVLAVELRDTAGAEFPGGLVTVTLSGSDVAAFGSDENTLTPTSAQALTDEYGTVVFFVDLVAAGSVTATFTIGGVSLVVSYAVTAE